MKRGAVIFLAALIACWSLAGITAEKKQSEEERKAKNDTFDKLEIRHKHQFLTDTSRDFLIRPEDEETEENFLIARTPPEVKFVIVPDMVPEYFDEHDEAYMVSWANWGHVTRSHDNRFFSR